MVVDREWTRSNPTLVDSVPHRGGSSPAEDAPAVRPTANGMADQFSSLDLLVNAVAHRATRGTGTAAAELRGQGCAVRDEDIV